MKRRDLLRHLSAYGCALLREGGSHCVWQSFSSTVNSVLVFQGAKSYITPSWYPSKQAHGKVVPTWNYVVVHAHGLPRAIEDREWLLQHVNQSTNVHEAEQALLRKVSDAPQDYIDLGRNPGRQIGLESP